MFKKALISLLLIQTIFFSCGCINSDHYTTTKNIVTDYGEALVIKVRHTSNLHHDFLTYFISGDNDKSAITSARFYMPEDVPEDPFTLLEHIAQTQYINFYRIQDVVIFSGETFMDTITEVSLADLEDYCQSKLRSINVPERQAAFLSTFEKVPEAFIETKQLRYIQYCVPYLLEKQNTSCIPLIQRWAAGDISEEEITINSLDGYSKTDLIEWAKQFRF